MSDEDRTEETAPEPEEQAEQTALTPDEEAAAEEESAWAEIAAAENGEAQAAQAAEQSDEDNPPSAASDSEAEDGGKAKPASQEADEADIWASAPDELRSAFEAERARAEAAEHGRRSVEGRVSALQRRMDAMIAGTDKPSEPAQRQQAEPEQQNGAVADFRKEWDAFVSDYPEIATPVGKILDGFQRQMAALRDENQRTMTALQTVGEDRLHAASAEQERLVMAEHPDYADIADSDDFVVWYGEQPEFIQAAVMENAREIVNGSTVNHLVSLYKRDRGIGNGADADTAADGEPSGKQSPAADPIRKMQLKSASSPRPSPGAVAPEGRRSETEEDVWNEIIVADKRYEAAEARA